MRAIGFVAVMGIVIGVMLVIALLVLAFLGIRAALAEEKNRRLRRTPDLPRRDAGVPLFTAKRREEEQR